MRMKRDMMPLSHHLQFGVDHLVQIERWCLPKHLIKKLQFMEKWRGTTVWNIFWTFTLVLIWSACQKLKINHEKFEDRLKYNSALNTSKSFFPSSTVFCCCFLKEAVYWTFASVTFLSFCPSRWHKPCFLEGLEGHFTVSEVADMLYSIQTKYDLYSCFMHKKGLCRYYTVFSKSSTGI